MEFRGFAGIAGVVVLCAALLGGAGPERPVWTRPAKPCTEAGGAPPALAPRGPHGVLDAGGHGDVSTVSTGHVAGRAAVASAGSEGLVRVWDLATLAPIGTPFPGERAAPGRSLYAVALVGDTLIAGGTGEALWTWRLAPR
ncbi:hypothetical protein DP939_03035 [Spongiactinospora rosea]|uniref:WD40 repeat protein n=2 Tax=Spongiactinospora rosea TaxID=2248750 RepID=A0A366M7I1_9ACTN|nr:hypothetical protein DP939_03035 [Spongiactinospora rosea]